MAHVADTLRLRLLHLQGSIKTASRVGAAMQLGPLSWLGATSAEKCQRSWWRLE